MIAQISPSALTCAAFFLAGAAWGTLWTFPFLWRMIKKYSAPKQPDAEGSSSAKQ